MAVRKRLFHPDEVRAKIKTSQMINVLNAAGEGQKYMGGEVNPLQVTAAVALLKKTIPDLKQVDLQGNLEVNGSWTVKLG